MTKRVIRNGCTAVLITNKHGAGWSSAACMVSQLVREQLIFDPILVSLVEELHDQELTHLKDMTLDLIKDRAKEITKPEFFGGGAEDLVVEWIPVGHLFQIREFGGMETIQLNHGADWLTA